MLKKRSEITLLSGFALFALTLFGAAPRADAQPTVTIIQPSSNAVFTAGVNIRIQATAYETNATNIQVEFYAGANDLGGTSNSPYAITWSSPLPGAYDLTAVATDNLGITATSAVVNIVVDIPPTVAIASPTNLTDFSLPGTFSLTAAATDADGSVTDVVFFADGNPLCDVPAPPYTCAWAETNLGIHQLSAQATDNNGLSTFSSPLTVFVTTIGGTLTGNVSAVPQNSVVDLTREGTNDWVHWGLFTQNSFDHKAGVASQISNFTPIGTDDSGVYQFADNANGYSWSDGTPNSSITNTTTGIYDVGIGAGFQISAPAGTNVQTLRVYVGAYAAQGQLVAYLSDFTAPIYVDASLDNSANGPGVVYTFNYAAASGQSLIVQYRVAQIYNSFGNVTLQAATFSTGNAPPTAAIVAPANNSSCTVPTNLLIQAAATDSDGTISKVEFFQGPTNKLATVTNSPYSFVWSNVVVGTYNLTAKATDNQGAIFTSAPVTIFAITNGGFMHATLAAPASTVNLTTEGKSDWAHWGDAYKIQGKDGFFNHKNVASQLSDVTNLGPSALTIYNDNPNAYTWTDGTPILADTTTTGIYKTNLAEGFQITAPADTTLRRLKVYVGVFAAQGKLEATLSDFSSLPYLNTSVNNFNAATGVYTIIYSAGGPGRKLTVKYTSGALFDEAYGNVTLQAATLASPAPTLMPFNQPPPGLFRFSFPTEQDWRYAVQFTDSLSPTNWQILTNFVGNGADAVVTDPASTNRFYRAKMSF